MYMVTTALPIGVSGSDTFLQAVSDGIEFFIDRMGALEAQTRRSRPLVTPSRPVSRANANSNKGREKIELVLYTSPSSEKSQKALRAVRAVLADYDGSQVKFIVCDLSTASGAEADSVVFTPTLVVKRSPGPRTWIVGNLDHPDLLIDLLEVSGVDRRR